MDTLPLELREQIFGYLLSRQDLEQVVMLPVSTKFERIDIYNLRLTSKRMCEGAAQTFASIVQDVPTECREESLNNLAALLDLPDVCKVMTCLALNTCKMSPPKDVVDGDTLIDLRALWLQEKLSIALVTIIRKAPQLRSLACTYEDIRGLNKDGLDRKEAFALYRRAHGLPHPFLLVQKALVTTQLTKTLETIVFLNRSFDFYLWPLTSLEDSTTLSCPNLRHLTIALSAGDISYHGLRPSNLMSLHIVVDNISSPKYLEPDENTPYHSWPDYAFPDSLTNLRHYTISGKNDCVPVETLDANISPILEHISTLQSLTIRDMKVVIDISYVPEFESNGRIALLVFDNVKYCMTDEITLSGPSEPKELDDRCKLFVELLGHAEESRVIPGTA